MNRRTLTAITLAAALAVAAPFLYAQRGERPDRRPGGAHGFAPFAHLEQLRDELDLSDAQIEQITAIFRELHESNAPYREELRGGIGTAFEVLLQNPDDVAAAKAIADRKAQLEAAMTANAIDATAKAIKLLTPEQRTELAQLLQERRERRPRP